ncbi:MAG: hypothetical protein RLZZ507_96 [Cyanobacteriota bacterium]|jgi:hypothetical protein
MADITFIDKNQITEIINTSNRLKYLILFTYQVPIEDIVETGEIIQVKRQTAKIMWGQIKFIDTQAEPREAFSRICIGLGSNIQCLITFDYWADQAEQLTPV